MKKIAIVGIDGCGKSTIAQRCRREGVAVMTCPAYHETPRTPHAELSRALDALSRLADRVRSFELKAAAMYLQMTLYGDVERSFDAPVLVSEHHAIVDSLAYAPLYVRAVRGPIDRKLEGVIRESVPFDAILRLSPDLWELPPQVAALFRGPDPVAELGRRCKTTLPDVALMLDVPVGVALARLKSRQGSELHESPDALAALRESTRAVVTSLGGHVVDATKSIDETVAEVLRHV